MKNICKFVLALIFISALIFPHSELIAGFSDFGSKITKEDIDASADKLDFVGDNIVAEGHVAVKYKDIWITADKAIINLTTKDIEATGRVSFIQRSTSTEEIDYKEYLKLLEDPDTKVTINGYVMTPTGRQKMEVTIVKEINSWTGKRAVGNLTTGVFDLGEFSGRYDFYYISAKKAERAPGGNIMIKDAKITTCEYVEDDHEHYSLTATSVELYPKRKGKEDSYYTDKGKYHMCVWNAVLRIGDVPIFYFPFLYKPPDEGLGLGIRIKGGRDSDWGYFILTKKTLKYDFAGVSTSTTLMADYYSKRGPGGGVAIDANTQDSFTEAMIYGVHDKDFKKDERKARFKYDQERYDMYISHLNHITPRLDFRGHLEHLSDPEFLHDFFKDRSDLDPQPISFGALEYQFDRLSVGAYVRPRTNDFFSVVETLPELRIDTPRQELFKNIYYQGEMSYSYKRMKWRDYDYPRSAGGIDTKDYESSRFDSLHMFYYPFELFDSLNIIPRAGVRMTAYSKTSKTKIDQDQLNTYFSVDSVETDPAGNIVNYDSKGGSEVRFTGELGVEMNAKFYRTWDDAKSAFWEVDGLRHVAVPYLNYNYVPDPTLDRDKIYYFDDIDRITEQHFVRLGIQNRLQTRRGAYGKQEIYDWASLEHYVDFHFHKEKGFDNMGDFGTIFKWNPFPDFTATADFLMDLGEGEISKFETRFDYKINEDWNVFIGYLYQNDYDQRSVYSMGSALTDITSGSSFSRSFSKNQTINAGIGFPIFDDKTRGELEFYYDLERNTINQAKARIVRTLHCWEVGAEYRVKERNDDVGDREWKNTFMLTLSLTDMPDVKISAKGGPSNE